MADYGQNVLGVVVQVVFPGELFHVHLFTLIMLDECLVHALDQFLVLHDSILNKWVEPAGLVEVFLADLETHCRRNCTDSALVIAKLDHLVD